MTAWLGLSSGRPSPNLDRHLAVLLALEEAYTGKVVRGYSEWIGGGNPFPLPNPVGEARAVARGFGCRRFGNCGSGFC